MDDREHQALRAVIDGSRARPDPTRLACAVERLSRAWYFIRREQLQEALDDYELLVEQCGRSVADESWLTLATILLLLGTQLLAEGQLGRGEQMVRRGCALAEEHFAARLVQGELADIGQLVAHIAGRDDRYQGFGAVHGRGVDDRLLEAYFAATLVVGQGPGTAPHGNRESPSGSRATRASAPGGNAAVLEGRAQQLRNTIVSCRTNRNPAALAAAVEELSWGYYFTDSANLADALCGYLLLIEQCRKPEDDDSRLMAAVIYLRYAAYLRQNRMPEQAERMQCRADPMAEDYFVANMLAGKLTTWPAVETRLACLGAMYLGLDGWISPTALDTLRRAWLHAEMYTDPGIPDPSSQ
ncbi:MAG: hypothetical protein AB1505_26975 [Candidatus Latescibacterota bacterium]